jgi:tetratricopeptide (TPR) repeat protein
MQPGTEVAERFEIERVAGSGGMGTVYRAKDRLTGECVALKVTMRRGASEVGRFLREGRALAEVKHPAVPRYVAHGVTPTGEAFIAMEWLEGEDLGHRLEQKGLTVGESVELVRRVAEGLAAAHARGLVHRDIKPSNVFLVGGDLAHVKLLDFGVVHFGATDMTVLTLPGMMLGTPGYMPPEQVRGGAPVDARADVYALGCVFYGCLTGRPPFAGDHPIAILTKVLFDDILPPSLVSTEIPEAVEAIVMRMLAKDPEQRPRDAAAVLAELATLKLGPPSGRAPPTPHPSALTGSEQRLVSIVLAAPPGGFVVDGQPAHRSGQSVIAPADLRARIERLGARFEPLPNGAYVVVSTGAGTATDHAVRAARCALALRESLQDMPIAVATGRSDVSSPTPAGEVIDRAVNLLRGFESSGELDTVVDTGSWDLALSQPLPTASLLMRPVRVDEVTAGLLDARFEVVSDGMMLELRRERDTLEPTRTLMGKRTPCVGREREIGVLLGAYEETVSEPVARAILVTAPAGAGKSRLRHEVLLRLRERGDTVQVWMGRGDPMSAGSPFGMLSSALRRALKIRDDEPLDARKERLSARVARSVAASEAKRVTEFLGELLGVPFADDASLPLRAARQDPILRGDQMRRAWEDFVVAECSAHPVVLVLEDLHWGDVPTARFVDAALRVAGALPLLVLAFGRPETLDLFPALWAERGLSQMHLAELTRKASEKLVRAVLGDEATPASVDRVVTQAGGNAFFLEELIRAVAEGRGRALPETVLAMVQARLEALEPEARRVLRGASVFGQTFWRRGVRALLGGAQRTLQLDEWLRQLESSELVGRRTGGRFHGETEYAFRHAIVCEAAYAMLTDSDRVLGHKLAVEWLVQVGETDPVVLAEHYQRAGQPERAAGMYHRAAAQALEGNDFASVIARAERGVACGADRAMSGALQLLAAEAQRWRGDFVNAEACALRALASLDTPSALRFAAVGELVTASGKLGHQDRVVSAAQELEHGAPESDAAMAAYVVATARAVAQLLFIGRYDLAGTLLARLDRELKAGGGELMAVAGWVDDARSTRAMLAGDMAACLVLTADAAKKFEEAGDLRNACTERGYVGYGYMELGLYADAERVLREAIAVAGRMGLHTVVSTAKHNLGLVLARRGKPDEGATMVREAAVELHAQGDERLEGASREYLGKILQQTGDLEGAERELRTALAIVRTRPPLYAGVLAALASVLLAKGEEEEALKLTRDAVGILGRIGVLEEGQSVVRIVHVEALAASGAMDEAREALRLARSELLERADRISEPAARASFLENVPENARTRALARTWKIAE